MATSSGTPDRSCDPAASATPRAQGARPQRRARWAAASASVLLAGGLGLAAAGPARAEPECLHASNDLDGDGTADRFIGMPGAGHGAGAVQVRLSNEDDPYVVEIPNPRPAAGAAYGTALTLLTSYEQEGQDQLCSQLVVGAPGAPGGGEVAVLVFDEASRSFTERAVLRPGRGGVPATSAGRFGAALDAPFRPRDASDPRPDVLWVGSPGATSSGVAGAGRATAVVLGPTSAVPEQAASYGWSGTPSPSAGFGSAFARVGSRVYVGAPGQSVSGAAGGAIAWLHTDGVSVPERGSVSQASPGIPGDPEAGDRFGAALAADVDPATATGRLVVGAPGEAIGSIAQAGYVEVLPLDSDGSLTGRGVTAYSQDTAGVAGAAERGDRFGSAFGLATAPDRHGLGDVLVGVPGEDVGSVVDAGMVQTLTGDRAWHEDSIGVPGTAERGDAMGAAISHGLIGVPGENDGAGMVLAGIRELYGTTSVLAPLHPAAGFRFGAAVG